jgi:hypothetical protein
MDSNTLFTSRGMIIPLAPWKVKGTRTGVKIRPESLAGSNFKDKTRLISRGTMFEANAPVLFKKNYSGQQLGFVIYSSLTPNLHVMFLPPFLRCKNALAALSGSGRLFCCAARKFCST